jgi:hypothetical protein
MSTDDIYLFLLQEFSDIPIRITSDCTVHDWIQIFVQNHLPLISYKMNGVEVPLEKYITPNFICLLEENYNKI